VVVTDVVVVCENIPPVTCTSNLCAKLSENQPFLGIITVPSPIFTTGKNIKNQAFHGLIFDDFPMIFIILLLLLFGPFMKVFRLLNNDYFCSGRIWCGGGHSLQTSPMSWYIMVF